MQSQALHLLCEDSAHETLLAFWMFKISEENFCWWLVQWTKGGVFRDKLLVLGEVIHRLRKVCLSQYQDMRANLTSKANVEVNNQNMAKSIKPIADKR